MEPPPGGEKSIDGSTWVGVVGSPPRGRGKVPVLLILLVYIGITPAWAGKRSTGPPLTQTTVDHPRVGGEKALRALNRWAAWGSPPRGRGKVDGPPAQVGRGRITPAQAGKRKSATKETKGYEDHPRVGGEKCCSSLMRALWSGSPPRRRGKVHQHLCGLVGLGITPAWAGKRSHRRQGRLP